MGQSYQISFSFVLEVLLLRLSVCNIRKHCLRFKIAKLNSKKGKKSWFYEEKSLVGSTLDVILILTWTWFRCRAFEFIERRSIKEVYSFIHVAKGI
jgi:hypothetical protein